MNSNDNTVRAEQQQEGEFSLELHYDQDAESPRQWDNLGTMVCAHRRYDLGDDDGLSKAQDVVRKHYSESFLDDYDLSSHPEVYRLMLGIKEVILLPLYLYDHSGITMKTTPFSCPWDGGQVGFIFITKAAIRSEYGWKNVTEKRVEMIKTHLRGEVSTYDQFISGDIYYFLTKKDDEIVDNCGGFYGSDPMKNGMIDHLEEPYATLAREGKAKVISG